MPTKYHASVEVYQFRVYLREISPMIWRRLLVRSDSTIADLHYALQIVMCWDDCHLNQFLIHGKRYGVYQPGGMTFSDRASQVLLSDLLLRPGERFLYAETISTAFVGSTVNEVISKRMVKKQQVRRTQKGAQLLLQDRTKTLNGDLKDTFRRWYPAIMPQVGDLAI